MAIAICVIGLSVSQLGEKDEPVSFTTPSQEPAASMETPAPEETPSSGTEEQQKVSGNIKTGQCGDNVFYEFDTASGKLSILGSGPMYDYEIYGAGANWVPFYTMNVRSLVIGEGVTHIGSYSFYNKGNLKDVTIADSVSSIGWGAFQNSGIESIRIPEGVETIKGECFYACSELKSVELPESLRFIEWHAFNESGLEEITLPYGLERIDEGAFESSMLRSVEIPSSVVKVENSAFGNCSELTDVTMGKFTLLAFDVSSGMVFSGENWEVPGNITIHGLSNSSTEVYALQNGYNFDPIDADGWDREGMCGDNVNFHLDIDGHFLYIEGDGPMWDFNDDKRHNYATPEMQALPVVPWENYKEDIWAVFVGDGVTSIGEYAFDDCWNLTEMDLVGVERIGEMAFQSAGVNTLVAHENLKQIGPAAFNACNALYYVDLTRSSVARLEASTFSACNALESVILPSDTRLYDDENGFTPFNAEDNPEIPRKLVLLSPIGSYAQTYAKEHDIPFNSIAE